MNEAAQKLAEQVAGKIHWGDSIEEVRAWLQEKKGIPEEDADQLVILGFKERR
jgi:hypothetical protein